MVQLPKGAESMTNYERICEASKHLTVAQQRKVLQYIQDLQQTLPEEIGGTMENELMSETKNGSVSASSSCPHCNGENVIRYGRKHGKQRYQCKDCLKVFVPTSRTALENSHSDECAWRTVIADTLNGHVSIDETAEKIGVCHTTAFNMRHKVLMTIENHIDTDPVILRDISELDETYVLESYKGRKFDDDAPRKPRKHGAKASSRGISEEQICIMAGVQRNGGPAYATTMNRAHPSKDEIKAAFKDHVGDGCVAFTDGLKGYKHLEDIVDCVVESVSVEDQKNSKTANLNNVNGFHSHIKNRYNYYRGVSTKYINRYNALFSATYRPQDDLVDEIYELLTKPQDTSSPVTCRDVYTKGLVEI